MYAIIKTGGKQYRVAEGDIIDVELLDAEGGARVKFNDVLFLYKGSSIVGAPVVPDCVVVGEVVGLTSGPKVVSMKYKPSHRQYRKFGHKQHYTRVKIVTIETEKLEETQHGT